MRQWFFSQIADFRAQAGFTTQFDVEFDERKFPHFGEIVNVVQGEMILYTWSDTGYKRKANVTFNISTSDSGSRLI